MAKKNFRNGLQSRLNDLEVKVEDMRDGALQSDEIACDTLTAATIHTTDIRLTGVGGAVLQVKQDDETPATATLDDTGALEVTALTIGGEAVTPGGGSIPQVEYEVAPWCSSDAATSGVTAYDVIPLVWWKQDDGLFTPPGGANVMGKALIAVVRDGDTAALACVTEVPFAAVASPSTAINSGLVAFGDSQPASGPTNPISGVVINAWTDGEAQSYSVLAVRVKRSTVLDIAAALGQLTGPWEPYPYVVRVSWPSPPEFAEELIEGTDYGYGAPPDWPATPAAFGDLVGAGTMADPLSFWKLPSPIAGAQYEEGATITLADLSLDPSGNTVPWYATEVRIRLTTGADVNANVGAWVPRHLAHTASATLDPAAVALIGLDNPFNIYVEYKALDTAATVKSDFAQSTLVASGGGA